MCLIVVAHEAHPRQRLVVAANRDEFYARPTSPATWWTDAPHLLAGRDLREGGTWMGVTRGGRFAAVTNYREMATRPDAPSRGALVADYLRDDASAEAYVSALLTRAHEYNGFNLLVGDADGLFYLSNRAEGYRRLEPGVYGLSNALLDTPWPKVVRARRAMSSSISRSMDDDGWSSGLWEMLGDRVVAADDELPETGVGAVRERVLSPPFIASDVYGTRSSTVLTLSYDGEATFVERAVSGDGGNSSEVRISFVIDPSSR